MFPPSLALCEHGRIAFRHHTKHHYTSSQKRVIDGQVKMYKSQIDFIICTDSSKSFLQNARFYSGTLTTKLFGGILVSLRPSVCSSICPYYWKINCIIGRSILVLEDQLYYWKINYDARRSEDHGIIRSSAVLKTINRIRWKLPIKENKCKKMTTLSGVNRC